jgi:hypothetical protein
MFLLHRKFINRILHLIHRANEPLLLIAGVPISQQSAALLGVLVLALIAVLFRLIENYNR